MKIPCRVQICAAVRYSGRFAGMFGDAVRMAENKHDGLMFGVKVDGIENKKSRYDVFWFSNAELRPAEKINFESEENEMLLPNYSAANVRFLTGSNTGTDYTYALYDDGIEAGDTVVVQTGHHGLALAQVVEINPELVPKVACGREIVTKVDFTAFYERQAKAKRIAKLRQSMDAKVKELQTIALYDMLAEKDPALREMLKEYRELSGL